MDVRHNNIYDIIKRINGKHVEIKQIYSKKLFNV